jgi:hypothetical protein
LATVVAGALGLVAASIDVLRHAMALPRAAYQSSEERQRVRAMMGGMAAAVVAEVAGLVGVVQLSSGHVDRIPALAVAVVGLHFLPLARIFRVPRYYPLGVCFCVAAVITLFAIPANEMVGHARLWWVYPSLGTVPIVGMVAWGNLHEAIKALDALHLDPAILNARGAR